MCIMLCVRRLFFTTASRCSPSRKSSSPDEIQSIMATMSKMLDLSTLASASVLNTLHHTPKDDIAFLALLLVSGILYNLYFKEKPDPYHHVWFEKPQQTDADRRGPETRDIALKLEESVSLLPLDHLISLSRTRR